MIDRISFSRLRAAGGDPGLFTRSALYRLWRFSRGVPRLLNVACDNALLSAYAERNGLSWDSPRLAAMDLQYHDVSQERGLFYRMQQKGLVERVCTDEAINTAWTYGYDVVTLMQETKASPQQVLATVPEDYLLSRTRCLRRSRGCRG